MPLHLAASNGHDDVIKYLVKERGARVEPKLTVKQKTTHLPFMAFTIYSFIPRLPGPGRHVSMNKKDWGAWPGEGGGYF